MNIVDIIIIIFILLMGVIGSKRGVFKEIIFCVGTILLFVLAFKFKDILGNVFLLNLPMFDFPNVFQGVITLNILVYQLLAFVVTLIILLIIFEVILSITGIFEKILKMTIILGIPSKILGFLGGLVEGYVIAFVLLFFLTQPAFNFTRFMESKYANAILTSSPVLTSVTSDTVGLVQDIYNLKDESDKNILNGKILDMMLDKKIVSYDIAKKLYDSDKIKFDGIEIVLDKYNN
ncbi:MAG: CvpA family protein [Bacilli bacterium]|nr:CvpA family protein [Bacilli bacterium]